MICVLVSMKTIMVADVLRVTGNSGQQDLFQV